MLKMLSLHLNFIYKTAKHAKQLGTTSPVSGEQRQTV